MSAADKRELSEAYGYATRFLQAFCENNSLRQVEPLPTLCGVLTQIDNATTATREAMRAKCEATARGLAEKGFAAYDVANAIAALKGNGEGK